ncbi:hypothetical protein LIA77_05579 [Sarocladium implicatum]|nr:hypothetical protein LIA77_05579 [Sarocladium implicatum]
MINPHSPTCAAVSRPTEHTSTRIAPVSYIALNPLSSNPPLPSPGAITSLKKHLPGPSMWSPRFSAISTPRARRTIHVLDLGTWQAQLVNLP